MFSSAKKPYMSFPVSKILRDLGIEKGKKPELVAFKAKRRGGSRELMGEKLKWRGGNGIRR